MRKVYCYAEKEEKPEEIDHSGDIVQDLSSLDISDLKNRSFFFIGGEIIENPYYEPSEYMKRVYAAIDAQYEKFYRSDNDKKDSEEKDDARVAENANHREHKHSSYSRPDQGNNNIEKLSEEADTVQTGRFKDILRHTVHCTGEHDHIGTHAGPKHINDHHSHTGGAGFQKTRPAIKFHT